MAIALFVTACEKQGPDRQKSSGSEQQTTSISNQTTSDYVNRDSLDAANQKRRHEQWDSIHQVLWHVVYPASTYLDTTGHISGEQYPYLAPSTIHLVPRETDTLVLATFSRYYGRYPYSQPGYMDLVAATLRNGSFTIIDTVAYVASGQFATPRHVREYAITRNAASFVPSDVSGAGFCRLGKNVWGWIVSDYGEYYGTHYHNASVYALDGKQIVNLGTTKVGGGHIDTTRATTQYFNSKIVVVDDTHPRISDLAIIWFTNNNGTDSSSRVTFHKYREGKGYEF
jgi:hypothetical protein